MKDQKQTCHTCADCATKCEFKGNPYLPPCNDYTSAYTCKTDTVFKPPAKPAKYFVIMYNDSKIIQSQEFDDFETALREYRYMCSICEFDKQTDFAVGVLSCELQQRNTILSEKCF